MAIIRQYHRDTDTTYVYESISYWDAEKGQSRSKRKCIGKIDPETGEMVPTGKRGKQKKEVPSSHSAEETERFRKLYETEQEKVKTLSAQNTSLKNEMTVLKKQNAKLLAAVDKIQRLADSVKA